MMRPIASLAVVLALPVVVAAAADQTASPGKGLTNPFFPYSVGGVSDDVLREMGYTPMRYLYVGVNLDKSPVYDPKLKDQKGQDSFPGTARRVLCRKVS